MTDLELFRRFVDYRSTTGELRWRADRQQLENESTASYNRWLPVYAGREAGTTVRSSRSTPHRMIKIRGKCYQAARVAWMVGHNKDVPPRHDVSHIDSDCLNLRQSNLTLKARRHDSNRPRSSYPGVSWYAPHQRWRVFGNTDSPRPKYLGTFEHLDDAVSARRRWEDAK